MIEEMSKVQIIGPKGCLDECIKVLHAAAVLHIETIPAPADIESFLQKLPMEKEKMLQKETLEKGAERLRNLTHLLKEPGSFKTARIAPEEINGYLEEIKPLEGTVKSLRAEKDDLSEEIVSIGRYERLLHGFAPIVSRLGGLKNFDIVGLTVEKTREDIPGLIDSEIKKITGGNYQIYVKDLDEKDIGIVLAYERKYDSMVRYLLSGKSISEVRLPDEYSSLSLVEALKLMGRKKAAIPARVNEVERELQGISYEWYGKLAGLLKAIYDAIDEIGVIMYAAQSRFTFVIEGWVPVKMLELLKEKFKALFDDRVLVRELEIKDTEVDLIPVHIKNYGIFKPFEVFLSALPPPRYGSVDPTPYVAVFFPIFFGLIVGDIGYGAVIFLISLYLRRRFRGKETLSSIASVLSVSSVSAIIFGFLFGEFFGDLGTRFGLIHPVLFHRTEALKTTMVLTIGIGIGHVLLGIIIGIVNQLSRGRRKEAGAKIAYLTVIVSFLFILAVMFNFLPRDFLTPGVAALAVSFIVLTVLEGVLGPLEFLKALGNILSYVRIMAVGTASVVMATVANRIGGLSEDLIVGIIAAGVIHALNVVLSVLSPSIQSMRLHYVEFFSKFYEGGGRKYTPFKKR
ncbi:MAG: hypothetical protein HY889_00570 [Deltaproteobacteria bacterium]|nr:hypothetical protein [Deltaproteobacteria bacterium]